VAIFGSFSADYTLAVRARFCPREKANLVLFSQQRSSLSGELTREQLFKNDFFTLWKMAGAETRAQYTNARFSIAYTNLRGRRYTDGGKRLRPRMFSDFIHIRLMKRLFIPGGLR
jgi:hypothetical protein